jgi:putative transposase
LQVAPSGYRRQAARQRDPALRCARAQRDDVLIPEIERVWQVNLQVYGADKVWRQMKREGTEVARCTVERLMSRLGLSGAVRGRIVRTTVPDPKQPCPLDRVNRQFRAERPNQLWVSDFTYVSTWQGWLYVAFVIDVYARRIVGWRVSRTMHTDFVLDALEQALYARQPERDGSLVHHSDRGSQYVSIRYSERLAEAGVEPSVGSKGDSYDNALAETINGLYKAELIHRRGPWKTREAVELATLEWVAWFNHVRLLEPIGYIPPAEAEANYYRQLAEQAESSVCT